MDINAYYKSLSNELISLKDRIRYIINGDNWQADGEWKESVLRSVLRRHLPLSIEDGSGFIVSPDSHSKQIDVLLYDSSAPVIFKEGDLSFVPANAVRGIIEVKSKIPNKSFLKEALQKLSDKAEFISGEVPAETPKPFVGLFAYESGSIGDKHIGECLFEASQKEGSNSNNRIVNHVSINTSQFSKYWANNPAEAFGSNYCKWHIYNFPEKSFGYFIQNVVHSCSIDSMLGSPMLWFPREGKEPFLKVTKSLNGENNE